MGAAGAAPAAYASQAVTQAGPVAPPALTRGICVCQRLQHPLDGLRLEPRHLQGGAGVGRWTGRAGRAVLGACRAAGARASAATSAGFSSMAAPHPMVLLQTQPTCSLGSSGSMAGSDRRAKNVRIAPATRPSSSAGSAASSCPLGCSCTSGAGRGGLGQGRGGRGRSAAAQHELAPTAGVGCSSTLLSHTLGSQPGRRGSAPSTPAAAAPPRPGRTW